MSNSNTIRTVRQAIDRYMKKFEHQHVMQPRADLCYVSPGGLFIMRNTNGHLAVVTQKGEVLTKKSDAQRVDPLWQSDEEN